MSSAVLKTSEARSRGRNAVPVPQSSGLGNCDKPHEIVNTRSLCRLQTTSPLAVCAFGLPHHNSTASCQANCLPFIPLPPFVKGYNLPRRKPYAPVHCSPNHDPAIEMTRLCSQYKLCLTLAVVLAKTGVHHPRLSGGQLDPHCRKVAGSSLIRSLSIAYPASSTQGNLMPSLRLSVKFRCFRIMFVGHMAAAFSR
jgi:hypothetical protein